MSDLPHNHTDGDIDPDGDKATGHDSGPVLALLARGLELWLRQQCEAIEAVEIHLEGSALKLLRGRLEGVRLSARGVIYQAMEIERVELRSNGIRVRMGPLLRHQRLELENPFQIEGQVALSGEGLDRSLRSPRWQDLGRDLARGLLAAAIPAGSGDSPRPGSTHGPHHRCRHHRCHHHRRPDPGGGGEHQRGGGHGGTAIPRRRPYPSPAHGSQHPDPRRQPAGGETGTERGSQCAALIDRLPSG